MSYQEFIKPELLILIPVLYFIGEAIKKSKISNTLIPLLLGCTGILLSGIYLFASTEIIGVQAIATAVFTALTQGVLCAAASVYTNQLIKQAGKGKAEAEARAMEKEKEEQKED